MKKTLIKILAITALLLFIPSLSNTMKASTLSTVNQLSDEEVRTGTVIKVNLSLFGLNKIVFIRDYETGAIYAGYTDQDVDSGDSVTYVKKQNGGVIIRDVRK